MIEGNLKALVLLEARDLLFACKISTKHDKCHHQDPKLFSSQVRDIFFWEGEEPVFSGQVTQYVESNSLPPLSKTHGEGNGTPLQYSCLENPVDGGAWWAAVYGVAQSQTRLKRLSSSSNKTQLNTPNISFKLLVLSFSLSISFLCSLIIIYLYIYS